MFSKRSNNVEKAILLAKVALGVTTNVAFIGACWAVVKHVRNEEEQKKLILKQLAAEQAAAEK